MRNFIAVVSGISGSRIRDCHGDDGMTRFWFVFGSLQLATAHTRERIFAQNTSKDVVPVKDLSFGGPDD